MATQKRKPKKPPAAAKRPRGRPTVRTDDLIEEVLEWIGDGNTLRAFCRRPGKPKRRTVDDWRAADKLFSARFARAREDGAHEIAERCYELANKEPPRDKLGRIDGAWVQWRRNQIDHLLKLLAKWFPKLYGDRVEIEHSGQIDLADAIRKARERAANR